MNKPGVYERMKIGSRLEDLIKEAGGLTKADSDRIPSLAKKLRDEDCIVVANIDKAETVVNTNSTQDEKSDIININTADKDSVRENTWSGTSNSRKNFRIQGRKGLF